MGSKPQYRTVGPFDSRSVSAGMSVQSDTRPRHCNSSKMPLLMRREPYGSSRAGSILIGREERKSLFFPLPLRHAPRGSSCSLRPCAPAFPPPPSASGRSNVESRGQIVSVLGHQGCEESIALSRFSQVMFESALSKRQRNGAFLFGTEGCGVDDLLSNPADLHRHRSAHFLSGGEAVNEILDRILIGRSDRFGVALY